MNATTLVCLTLLLALAQRAQAAEQHVLENPYLALTFDGHNGGLLQIHNKATGLDYIVPGGEGRPVYQLSVYPQWAGPFLDDRKVKTLGPQDGPPPEVHRERTEEGERLVFRHQTENRPTVQWAVELPSDSRLATWRITVDNPQLAQPGQEWRVTGVRFPILSDLQPSENPTDTRLAWPFAQGELLSNPRANPPAQRRLTYMGWASMSWLDLYAPRGGLYLASYDPTYEQTDLEFVGEGPGHSVALAMAKLHLIYPGEQWTSERFVTGVHEGDWRWGADRYREYFDAHYTLAPRPPWLDEADGWLGTGGANYNYADLVKMYEDARWLGLDYLQCWAQMVLGNRYYCFYMPDPARGGEAELTRAVQAIRAAGGHIGFYVNVWTWDASIPARIQQYANQLPAGATLPDWRKEFHRYSSVFSDGSRATGTFDDGYAGMCPEAQGYRDYLKYWIVDRYIRTYGCDAWYLDSCPVTMFGGTNYCYSTEHADRPHGITRGFMQLTETLRREAAPTQIALGSESTSDIMLQNTHWALGADFWGLSPNLHPEIFDYTFPGVPLFAGSCNRTQGARAYLSDAPEELRPEDVMNAAHLLGRRFDALWHPLDRESSRAQHLHRLIALRKKIKRWLYPAPAYGEIGLGERPRGISARCFRHADGQGLTVTLVDLRQAREPFPLTLDLRELNIQGPLTAVLYTWDQEAKLAGTEQDGVLTLTVPGLKDDAGAVVLWVGG